MEKIQLPLEADDWSVTDRERWLRRAAWIRWITVAIILGIVPFMLAFFIAAVFHLSNLML